MIKSISIVDLPLSIEAIQELWNQARTTFLEVISDATEDDAVKFADSSIRNVRTVIISDYGLPVKDNPEKMAQVHFINRTIDRLTEDAHLQNGQNIMQSESSRIFGGVTLPEEIWKST